MMARLRVALGAEVARVGVGDVVADRAFADFVLGVANRVGERQGLLAIHAQKIEGEALRGLLPDAGQVFQFVDQPRDGRRKIRHRLIFWNGNFIRFETENQERTCA